MATISFIKGEAWVVARWVFKRFFSDVQEKFSINPDIQYAFEQAIALDGIHLNLLRKNKSIILYMFKSTIVELINDKGAIYQKDLDVKWYEMYIGSLGELLRYIENHEIKEDEKYISKTPDLKPINEDDTYRWKEQELSEVDFFNIVRRKELAYEIIGVDIFWEGSKACITMLVFSDAKLVFYITMNGTCLDISQDDIIDVSWYLNKILPCINSDSLAVRKVTYCQHSGGEFE